MCLHASVRHAGVLLGTPDGAEVCRGDGHILTWEAWLRHLLFNTVRPPQQTSPQPESTPPTLHSNARQHQEHDTQQHKDSSLMGSLCQRFPPFPSDVCALVFVWVDANVVLLNYSLEMMEITPSLINPPWRSLLGAHNYFCD